MKVNRTLKTTAVVWATDPGREMRSATSKYLHPLLGQKLIEYSISVAEEVTGKQPILLMGTEGEQVGEGLARVIKIDEEEKGQSSFAWFQEIRKALPNGTEHLLILCADRPLVISSSLEGLIHTHLQAASDDNPTSPLTILTYFTHQASSSSQVQRDEDGNVIGIEVGGQLQPAPPDGQEVLSDIYCVSTNWLWQAITKINWSATSDLPLVDLVRVAISDGFPVKTRRLEDAQEALKINSRIDLSAAEAILRQRVNHRLMLDGVSIIDPQTTYIEAEVEIGSDTIILPNTHLIGATSIGGDCAIGPNSYIQDASIGDHCKVNNSVVEGATLENNVDIGPFAHLRKGAYLAEGVHMGNFGEVKNSYLGQGTKMGHFSYVGDATVGANTNIGAGVITANYDGQRKHATEIGEGAFIGSDTMLVAPLKIGQNARTGAGSVVTKDVPANSLAVGMPARIIRKKEDGDGP